MPFLAFVAAVVTALAAGGGVATLVNRRAQGRRIDADTTLAVSTARKTDMETQGVAAKELFGPLIDSLDKQLVEVRALLVQARIDGEAAVARCRVEAEASVARVRLESVADLARVQADHAECLRRIAQLEAAARDSDMTLDARIDARVASLASQFGIGKP